MEGKKRRRLLRAAVFWGVFAVAFWQLPRQLMRAPAERFWDGDRATQQRLARATELALARQLDESSFSTGGARYDGEWLFATYMMAAMGFGQLAAEHPELRTHYLAAMDTALDRLIEPDLRRFDTDAWGHDALLHLEAPQAHVAFLGYLDLALSLRAWLAPGGRHEALNDAVTAALRQRFERAPGRMLQTYPGEYYPVDNASAIGAIGLHARAHGRPVPEVVHQWIERVRGDLLDDGLLLQALGPGERVVDVARGSGSALAAYFLSFADEDFAASLYDEVYAQLYEEVAGFGLIREYRDTRWALGDVDSGPLVAGYSVSATGFALGAARAHGDREGYLALASTVHLVGGPRSSGDLQRFAAGGPLGDALMLALLTAQPASRWRDPPEPAAAQPASHRRDRPASAGVEARR